MRISTIEGDRGYRSADWLHSHDISTTIDGREAPPHVRVADEEEGYIRCAVLDENGSPKFDSATGRFVEQALYGDVKVEVTKRPSRSLLQRIREAWKVKREIPYFGWRFAWRLAREP